MYESLITPATPAPASPEQATAALPAQRQPANVGEFVNQNLPLAQRVAEKTGVAPEVLLGQWGLETGWGKSVIPGTNNLGNIKDPSRRGPMATDNMTGSRDAYLQFETPDDFGNHYSGLIARRYASAMNSGGDAQKFFSELKRNGYAEDPAYVQSGMRAASMAASALGGLKPAAPTESPQYYSPQRGQYASLITPPPERGFAGAVADTGLSLAQGAVGAVQSLTDLAGANNPVSDTLGDASKFLQTQKSAQSQSTLANSQQRVREAEATGDWTQELGAYMQMLWDQPAEMLAQGVGSFATLGIGKLAQAAKLARSAKAAGMSKEAFFKTKEGLEAIKAASDVGFRTNVGVSAAQGVGAVKGSQYEQTFNAAKARGLSSQEAAALADEAQAYGGAGTGQQLLGGVLGAGAASVGPIERLVAGRGAAKVGGIPGGAAKGVLVEGGTEGAQGGQERYAGNAAAIDAGVLDESKRYQGVAGQAALEGTLGGVLGGGAGALESALAPASVPPATVPPVPPALQPVADKAAGPNSPLSRAAMASAAAAAPNQTSTPVDPVARLAELEAIGKGTPDRETTDEQGNKVVIPGTPGRFFTPEEKAEYDQLKALRDATPGMEPKEKAQQEDEILNRARAIEEATRTNAGLEVFRQEDSPVNTKQFLNDLAIAKSKSTNAALREQALSRLEFAASWAGLDIPAAGSREIAGPPTRTNQVMGMASDAGVTPQERSQIVSLIATYRNPQLPQATRQQALSQALEIIGRYQAGKTPTQSAQGGSGSQQNPAVLGKIPPQPGTPEYFLAEAERYENGAYQFMELGFMDEARDLKAQADSLREQAASARAGELGQELTTEDVADTVAPASQQTVDQATANMPRTPIVPEQIVGNGAPATEDGTAFRRKRKGQIKQLVAAGFRTAENRNGQLVLRNAQTGQEVILDSAADFQMARAAIKEDQRGAADQSPNSPTNDKTPASEAQIQAGNYAKPSDVVNGIKVRYENPAGSTRSGTDKNGKPWSITMKYDYGHDDRVVGADGDKLDIKVGRNPASPKIFVVDQINPDDGTFDEHKVILGANNEEDARQTYLADYEPGWQGLGAITEITKQQYDEWTASGKVTEPMMLGKEKNTFVVSDGGVPIRLQAIDTDEIGNPSAARFGRGKMVSKKDADLIKTIGAIFGLRVQFFRSLTPNWSSDGFYQGGNTLFLSERTTVSPLAVFGHEFMHLIKAANRKAYDSIAKVVSANVKDPKGYREDYFGKYVVLDDKGKKVESFRDKDRAEAEAKKINGTVAEQSNDPLTETELEELVADINGNLMMDSKFWREVFRQIASDHGGEAKGIIAQLSAFLSQVIDQVVRGLKGGAFNAGKFVNETKDIRNAFKEGLAQFISESNGKFRKMEMQAEILRSTQQSKGSELRRSEPREKRSNAIAAPSPEFGIHFSHEQRSALSGAYYGRGLKGSEAKRLSNSNDARLKRRVYFYIDEGRGVRPEGGVGGIAHQVKLPKLYDAKADTDLLWNSVDINGTESRILDAGYDGYWVKNHETGQGLAVVIGDASNNMKAQRIPRPGVPTIYTPPPQEFKKALMSEEIDSVDINAIPGSRMRFGILVVPAQSVDHANAELKRIGSPVRFSPNRESNVERAKREYAEVEAKYRGTDQWMKAPDGSPTQLNERQWVQTRTPSFLKWFGDWLQAHEDGGVWATKLDVSKVVTSAGEPLVVYHGTDDGGFVEFRQPGGTKRGDLGIFTTDDYSMAGSYVRRGRVSKVQLSADPTNQAELEALGYSFDKNDEGEIEVTAPDGYLQDRYPTMEEAVADSLDNFETPDLAGEEPGVYALFVNIRNPQETDFEGALWNGERPDQYVVVDSDGEQLYKPDGSAFFNDQDEAQAFADDNDGTVEPAPEHYENTDDVVREARRSGNDGAIIRNVVDDGGGGSYSYDPADVFAAFDPNQLKSADFNNGEFSATENDIRKSVERSAEDENRVSVVVGGKPGEFNWDFTKSGVEPPPIQAPTQFGPRLEKIGPSVHKILSSKKVAKLVEDAFGIKGLRVIPIHGSWLLKPEPSFALVADEMSFEQADGLSKMLGFAFAQDATVVYQPTSEETPGEIPAAYIGNDNKLTRRQLSRMSEAARKQGLDYSTTQDGKAVKFLYFGDDNGRAEFLDKVSAIKESAGLKYQDVFYVRSNLNEAENYVSEAVRGDGEGAWLSSGSAGSSDLFGRTVDSLVVPYAKAVGAEGYRFAVQRFADKFGLSEDQRDLIRESLIPKNGRSKSTVAIASGEEKLDITPTSEKGGVSVIDIMWALQNRSAQAGLIEPGDYSPRVQKVIAEAMADEVIFHVENPRDGKSAIGWYDRALKAAKKDYQSIFPELSKDADAELLFDALWGITSQGNDVFSNSTYGARVYTLVRDGSNTLPEAVQILRGTFGEETRAIENNILKLHQLIERNGYDAMRKFFNTKGRVSDINKRLREDTTLYYDGKSLQVEGQADQIVTGWMVFGPKIGSFINNLHGDYSTLTADLWFSRSWNRILGYSFVHAPALEAGQYQRFIASMVAEFNHLRGRDVEQKPADKNGNSKPWEFGTDMMGLEERKLEEVIADPHKALEFATLLEEDFRKGGYREKSDLRRAAKNWVENRNQSVAAPRTDLERSFQQDTAEVAQKIIRRRTGQTLTIADIQAALWFYEKDDLFGPLGGTNKKSEGADYAGAAKELLRTFARGNLYLNKADGRYVYGKRGFYLPDFNEDAVNDAAAVLREYEASPVNGAKFNLEDSGDDVAITANNALDRDPSLVSNVAERLVSIARNRGISLTVSPKARRGTKGRTQAVEAYLNAGFKPVDVTSDELLRFDPKANSTSDNIDQRVDALKELISCLKK